MKPKISIIVPIYNTAKYLDKCLSSIINQTMQEIEIICIDDCSSDNSYLIVEKYIDQDSRVSLIRHDKNKGLSCARNTGISAAKANYLASVDSDDYIKPEMMQTLWDASENGTVDVVCCGFERVDSNGEILSFVSFPSQTFLNGGNNFDIFSTLNPAFWNKLWKKSLFTETNIFFPKQLYYEDLATTPRLLSKSAVIRTIKNRLYLYLIHSDSITKTYSIKHIMDYFKVFDILLEYITKSKLIRNRESFLNLIDENIYSHAKNILTTDMPESEMKKYLSLLLQQKNNYLVRNFNIKRIHRHYNFLNSMGERKLLAAFMPKSRLTLAQQVGSDIFGLVFRPFIKTKQLLKLSEDPKSFFYDSKNKFTRLVGILLRIT